MAKAEVKPVYVLYGGDAFLLDERRREVLAVAVADADPQLAVSNHDATAELSEVLDDLRTAPLLSPRRVIVVSDADAFVSAYREQLESYLAAPAPTGTLVLIVSSWPRNTKLYKVVEKCGQAIDCTAPQHGELASWLRNAAAARGKSLDPRAAQSLMEWVGNDLAALDGEIEKLSLYVAARKTITEADVAAMVSSRAGPDAFDLTNAITAGNVPAALKSLGGMLSTRGDEFKTVGMIAWHLRKVHAAQEAIAAGRQPELRMPYEQKNAFLAMLRRRPMRKVQADFRRLIKADLAMKSGVSPQGALEQLVVELCS